MKKIKLTLLVLGIGLSFLTPLAGTVKALPNGGQITGGSGAIQNPSSNSMVIQQNSNKMITNWQQFNIGAAESVQFIQPGAGSVALNRVMGGDPSSIMGRLTANGQVFLANPSGVFFAPGAQVNVGGLIVSTLGISDQDFMDGNYRFTQDPARPLASIINAGEIQAGYVGLLAPAVQNSGTITANMGSVNLVSGTEATLDFSGDNLINFVLNQPVDGVVTDPDGNVLEDRVLNSGLIQADGGRVVLAARDAGDVIRNVVNNSGKIRAQSVSNQNGEIWLLGGEQGVVNVTGELDASGQEQGETGGTIHVLGHQVGLFDSALINVSGHSGGGTLLAGGDFQGQGSVPNAFQTYVGSNTQILAHAIQTGNGGKVILWADDFTYYFGRVDARGGLVSGNGGFVEVSGKQNLQFQGNVDVGAPHGDSGTLLLDPDFLTIIAGSGGSADGLVSGNNLTIDNNFFHAGRPEGSPDQFNATISEATLESLIGNIILQANLDIILNQMTNSGGEAGNFLTINDAVPSITFETGRNLVVINGGTGGNRIQMPSNADPYNRIILKIAGQILYKTPGGVTYFTLPTENSPPPTPATPDSTGTNKQDWPPTYADAVNGFIINGPSAIVVTSSAGFTNNFVSLSSINQFNNAVNSANTSGSLGTYGTDKIILEKSESGTRGAEEVLVLDDEDEDDEDKEKKQESKS